MKILFLSDNFPPEVNAASTRVFERARYWVKDGHDVTILTCFPNFPFGKVYEGYKNKWYEKEKMEGMTVIRIKTFITPNVGFILRTLDFLSYMVMAILVGPFQKKPDIIISTSPQFFTAIAGWVLSKIKRVPYVFEIGDLWPESIKGLGLLGDSMAYKVIEKIELFLYRQSAVVIAQTQAFKDNLVRRGINPEKIKVVMNAVDIQHILPIVEKDKEIVKKYKLKDKFIVGYIGTHGLSQDLIRALDVAKLIQEKRIDVEFLFVGEGSEKEHLIQYAKQIGLTNIRFIPQQTKSEIQRWWSVCDLALVQLKDIEVFKTVVPSKIFEAIGLGLPVLLIAPEGEASSLLEKEGFGVHLLPEQVQNCAKTIIELSTDDKKRTTLKKAALKASKIYSRENQAKEFIKVISTCGKAI